MATDMKLRLDSLRFLLSKCHVKFEPCEDNKLASTESVKIKTEPSIVKQEVGVVPETFTKPGFEPVVVKCDPGLLPDFNEESVSKEHEKKSCSGDADIKLEPKQCDVKLSSWDDDDDGKSSKDHVVVPSSTDIKAICADDSLKLKMCYIKLTRCDDEVASEDHTEASNGRNIICMDDKFKLKPCHVKLTRCDDGKDNNAHTSNLPPCPSETKFIIKYNKTLKRETYSCIKCKKKLLCKNSSNLHWLRRHASMEERPFPCDLCTITKTFVTQAELYRHMIIHTGEKPYACVTCKKRFREKYMLNQHRLIHSDEGGYPCTLCKRRFKQAQGLKHHVLTHRTNKKSHKRPRTVWYNDGLKLAGKLKVRRFQTSADGSFHCSQCSKTFQHRSKLKHHMITHSKKKPFKCPQCSNTYTMQSSLNRHMKIHGASLSK